MGIQQFWVRNGVAFAGLLLAIYLPDVYGIQERTGWAKATPYLFLVLLYGWIVFHNRILYERLFERDKRREYLGWLLLVLVVGSFNMTLSLRYIYDIDWPIPYLVKFYVFTITGLGVYITYRQLTRLDGQPVIRTHPDSYAVAASFTVWVDGQKQALDYGSILYLESLENYVRVVTTRATLVARLTMKQAEAELPNSLFIRISRSHLVNIQQIIRQEGNNIVVGKQTLPVGRTYKQYVTDRLKL